MTALLNIGGVDMPTPSSLGPAPEDESKAARNANGKMIIERIATKAKLSVGWKFLTAVQLATVLTATQPVNFTVVYLNPVTNSFRTATFYAGPPTMDIYDYVNGVARYVNIKVDLIEI